MKNEQKRSMKRTLQVRFVLLSTLAAALLLALVVFVSLLRSYGSICDRADHLIDIILETPDSPEIGDARYFSVLLSPGGSRFIADLSHTSQLPEKTAGIYTKQVMHSGKDSGFLEGWRYRVTRDTKGMHILFLSRKLPLEMFRDTREMLILVALGGTILAGAVLTLVSGQVVAPLVEANEKQKAFITAASHELKTPLAVISADSQLLEMELEGNEWIKDIQLQTQRLADMTQDLVYLSRCDEGVSQGSFIQFPISDLAEDVAASYRSLAESRNIPFRLSIQEGLSCTGDEEALRQLMTILLDNAFRYCAIGGSIRLVLEEKQRKLRFSVTNSARNVNEEELDRFTDRFYRGSTSAGIPGSGLGLSIALAICRRHKGKLQVTSPTGEDIRVTAVI